MFGRKRNSSSAPLDQHASSSTATGGDTVAASNSETAASIAPVSDVGGGDASLFETSSQETEGEEAAPVVDPATGPVVEGDPTVEGADPAPVVADPAPAEAAPVDLAAIRAEFESVYRKTSAADTDAWLADLRARAEGNPELTALVGELEADLVARREAAAERRRKREEAAALEDDPAAVADPAAGEHPGAVIEPVGGAAPAQATTGGDHDGAPAGSADEGGMFAGGVRWWYGEPELDGDPATLGKRVSELMIDPAFAALYGAAVSEIQSNMDVWDVVESELFRQALAEKNPYVRLGKLLQVCEAEGLPAAAALLEDLIARVSPPADATLTGGEAPDHAATPTRTGETQGIVSQEGEYTWADDGTDIHYVFRGQHTDKATKYRAHRTDGARLGGKATVLDPADLSKPMTIDAANPPAGTKVEKGKATLAKGTAVAFVEFDASGKYVHVQVGGVDFWVAAKHVTFEDVEIPSRFEIVPVEIKGSGATKVIFFDYEGERLFGTTDPAQAKGDKEVGVDIYDLTYASDPGAGDDVFSITKDAKAGSALFKDAGQHASVDEIRATGATVGKATGKEVGSDGVATARKLAGEPCVMLGEASAGGRAVKKVMLFDGSELLVEGKVSAWSEARRFALEEHSDGTYLVTARDANKPDQVQQSLLVAPAVVEKLRALQDEKVAELLGSKQFTEAQEQLLERCDEFRANPSLGAPYPTMKVPPDKLTSEDGETLSSDLVNRLNSFYRFLQWSNLVTGQVNEIGSGIRARSKAHELSTSWSLTKYIKDTKSRRTFAEDLVAIDGVDPTCGREWATKVQIDALVAAMALEDPTAADDGIAAVVKEIKSAHGFQTDQAAEGYLKGDAERKPNTVSPKGISDHCGGEAIDITFPFVFNYYDPMIDALALKFGLCRSVKDGTDSPEHWHYERVGANTGPETD